MQVKIKATGFGATALKDGTIIHFDVSEAKAKTPNRRKLEAVVDISDARRIEELGWGQIVDGGSIEEPRAELGDAVSRAEVAPEPEVGLASRVDVREGGDPHEDGPVVPRNPAKPGRKPAKKVPAKRTAKAAVAAVAAVPPPADPELQDDPNDLDEVDVGDDPEAGPA